jgi:hypothetical protein
MPEYKYILSIIQENWSCSVKGAARNDIPCRAPALYSTQSRHRAEFIGQRGTKTMVKNEIPAIIAGL